MISYIHSKCISCNETFKESDDIVVCPDCGTPYHRSCYEREGTCINLELHQSNKSWEPDYKDKFDGKEEIRCENCGEKNPPMNIFCNRCGTTLGKEPDTNQSAQNKNFGGAVQGAGLFGFPPNINATKVDAKSNLGDDLTVAEASEFIGKNHLYFLIQFLNFFKTGRKISLNFTAMLFPEFYFFYRKMFTQGIIIFILRFLTSIPTIISMFASSNEAVFNFFSKFLWFTVTESSMQTILIILGVISYGIMFFSGAFVNFLYYKKCLKTVSNIKKDGVEGEELTKRIHSVGGVSTAALVASIGAFFVLMNVVVYALNNL